MLARRLTTILPAMTLAEAVAGLTGDRTALVTTRPFRAPHHTISDVGLIGGGHIPMPGEVSPAHNGVIFLDELPEFRRHVLEVLRQPIDGGEVTIARVSSSVTFPARLMLLRAVNPCACGLCDHPPGVFQVGRHCIKKFCCRCATDYPGIEWSYASRGPPYPPSTGVRIVAAADWHEPYVRQWLGAMVSAGVIDVNPASTRCVRPAVWCSFDPPENRHLLHRNAMLCIRHAASLGCG